MLEQNTYILKINVVLDLDMINTHLGEILRVQISMSLSLAPTFSYHSRGGQSLHFGRFLFLSAPCEPVEITSGWFWQWASVVISSGSKVRLVGVRT